MIRGLYVIAILTVITPLLAVPAIAVSLFRPGSDITMRFGKLWSRAILAAAGVKPSYEGLENIDRALPCIYMCNHQSLLDIPALVPILPESTRFVAKSSLFWFPFLGWALAASEFISIDRKNRKRAIASLNEAAAKIRAGRPVVLFPEGTRSRDGKLAPFKRGAFRLALEAGIPVVPIAISGSGRVLPPDTIRVGPGIIRVRILDPIDVKALPVGELSELMKEVRCNIVENLDGSAALGAAEALPS